MKTKKESRIFSEQRINSVIVGLIGLAVIVCGLLYLFEIIPSEDGEQAKDALLFIGVGSACILFAIIKFIYESKYKNCLLFNISRVWNEEELAEELEKYNITEDPIYAEFESEFITVYVEYNNNVFEAHITKKNVTFYIDYTDLYINSLPEDTPEDALKDYSKYEEEYDSINMTKEEFVNKFVSYVLKNKDFL